MIHTEQAQRERDRESGSEEERENREGRERDGKHTRVVEVRGESSVLFFLLLSA